MEEVIRKEILYDFAETIKILQTEDPAMLQRLERLSDHAIEDVAVHKDMDLISITVLIYSIYKVQKCLTSKDIGIMIKEMELAKNFLQQRKFGKYNLSVKKLYDLVRRCNAKIKEHMQDVMDAARIKKGTILLQKGLSMGQAAGLMGLSNWDLQKYAGRTTALEQHKETIPAQKRVKRALALFQ